MGPVVTRNPINETSTISLTGEFDVGGWAPYTVTATWDHKNLWQITLTSFHHERNFSGYAQDKDFDEALRKAQNVVKPENGDYPYG